MTAVNYYLFLSALLFSIGIFGVLTKKNAIVVFMCIELMLNAVNLSIVAVSSALGQVDGQVFVFFVMAVAAAEAAVGLAIIMAIFRNFHSISVSNLKTLNG